MKLRSEHHSLKYFGPRLLVLLAMLFLILGLAQAVKTAFANENQNPDSQQLMQQTLGVAHDELIMLIISVVVIVEVIGNFKHLRRLPYKYLFLSSFGVFSLSAVFTVVEGLIFETFFNYCEHLSLMAASILLAMWCACVFKSRKPENAQ